jgi:hypothetical protein
MRPCGWQVHVFDDADPELQTAGLVGTAEVALKALIDADRVQGEVAVKDRAGKVSRATGRGGRRAGTAHPLTLTAAATT